MATDILVVIETSTGQVREPSLEAIGAAHDLATGESISALVIGSGIDSVVIDVAGRGVGRAYVADSPLLERYTLDGYAAVIETAIERLRPRLVLFGGTTSGRDLGPYLAARAGSDCLSDCVALRWDNDRLVATRPVYGGKMLVDVSIGAGSPAFAVSRAGAFSVAASTGSGTVEPLDVTFGEDHLRVRLTGVSERPESVSNLAAAERVVVGGRGLGSPEAFAMVEEFAGLLGAAVGATRAVTDAGWRPREEQVGQTGKTIRPNLYVGVGVSGAIQHITGMRGAETIVAINQDPDAPIFRIATIGIVGDVHEIVPAIIRALREPASGQR
jgi:electron transfer flavoprotein alpha subunit